MKKKLIYGLYLLSFVFVVFGSVELFLTYIVYYPEKCPDKWFQKLEFYYGLNERSIIQYEPKMAMYDSNLFYTLRPGKFMFKNSEFETPYTVNNIGCRDDEKSLNHPKIIMLGDSYGMGWGVQQDSSYASLVENNLNIRVLNMGISSYGTPREIKFLEEVNTDSLELLVIQYCPNDYGEIIQYLWNNNDLKISSEKVYDSIVDYTTKNKPYYLFKRTVEFLPAILGFEKELIVDTTKYPEIPNFNIYKGFLNIIRSSKKIPKHTKIIVFTLGDRGFNNEFMENVRLNLDQEFGSSLDDRMTLLDFSKVLTLENYFIVDPHINTSGHKLIADSLVKTINQKKKGRHEKKWHYDNGNVSIHALYYNHYKDGVTNYYWPNGNRSMQTYFTKGEKNGEEILFNENGDEIVRKSYKNGLEL